MANGARNIKAYIKTNLANNFIRPLKSPARVPILFNHKLNKTFYLCCYYYGFNNLTIKNCYSLFLINK